MITKYTTVAYENQFIKIEFSALITDEGYEMPSLAVTLIGEDEEFADNEEWLEELYQATQNLSIKKLKENYPEYPSNYWKEIMEVLQEAKCLKLF